MHLPPPPDPLEAEVERVCLPGSQACHAMNRAKELRQNAQRKLDREIDLYGSLGKSTGYSRINYLRCRVMAYQWLGDVYYEMYHADPPNDTWLEVEQHLNKLHNLMGDDLYNIGKTAVPEYPPEKFAGEP